MPNGRMTRLRQASIFVALPRDKTARQANDESMTKPEARMKLATDSLVIRAFAFNWSLDIGNWSFRGVRRGHSGFSMVKWGVAAAADWLIWLRKIGTGLVEISW
jgi:hypothetical protein